MFMLLGGPRGNRKLSTGPPKRKGEDHVCIFTSIYTWQTNRRKKDLTEDRRTRDHSFTHPGDP